MQCDHFVPPPMHMKPIKVQVYEPVPKKENKISAFEETIFLLELLREQKKKNHQEAKVSQDNRSKIFYCV